MLTFAQLQALLGSQKPGSDAERSYESWSSGVSERATVQKNILNTCKGQTLSLQEKVQGWLADEEAVRT